MSFYLQFNDRAGHRALTSEEAKDVKDKLKETKELQKQIAKLEKKLNAKVKSYKQSAFYSSVFRDGAGHPYDVRLFVLTGKVTLI